MAEKKSLNIIIKIFKFLIILVIVLIATVVLVQRVFGNNAALGGYRLFTIVTGSMEPEYQVADIIIAVEKPIDEIEIGDDLVYLGRSGHLENKVITHRVIRIDERDEIEFYTQGIANTGEDPVVFEEQIYGVVLKKSLILSFISKLVNSPIGFLLLIVLPASFLIGEELMHRFGKKSEE